MQNGLKTHNQKYDHQKCFVGHSHKAPWHDDIISACEETLPKFGLQPWYADDQFEPTKSLRDKVVEMIANARYGLYDLSWYQPDEQSPRKMPQNVLIELGMAIALNRPVLLLRHAENRASGLSFPTCLDSISQRIVEFSGGPTLKHALEERIPQWLDVPPERAWWMRYCLFGERICTYRESYPQIIQCGQKTIGCHIADGRDIDRPDFRSVIEDELGRYSDISFNYLDALLPTAGYDFQLCTYCQIVRSTPFAIYRITPETTADTFIAIGMSIALEKQFKCEIPKFLFTTDARSVPSLLAGYEVVEAKTTKERQKYLRKFIPIVLRKVRESVWKTELLPFVEFLPHADEIPVSKKDQTSFSEAVEENILSQNEEEEDRDNGGEIIGADFSEDKDALKQPEENIQPHSNNAQIYSEQGEAATNLSQYEEAISAYNKAIEIEPDNPTFYYNRGQAYRAQGKYEQAFEDFEMTIVLNPRYPDARRQRDMLWSLLSSSMKMPFHQRLRYEREQRGLSQVELAEKLDCDLKTINRWEAGKSVPQPLYRRKLCELFGMTLEELGLIGSVKNQDQGNIMSQEDRERALSNIEKAIDLISKGKNRQIVFTKEFSTSLKRLTKPTQQIVERKIDLLKENPAHPSLHTHRVRNAKNKSTWTCYIGRSLRLAYQIQNESIYLLGIGSHLIIDSIDQRQLMDLELQSSDISYVEEEKKAEMEDNVYCKRIIDQLTSRQLEVLNAFASGLRPLEVAEQLSISSPTVSTHTAVLLSLCREAWSIEPGERLDYRFLQLKFEKYFEEFDQSENE